MGKAAFPNIKIAKLYSKTIVDQDPLVALIVTQIRAVSWRELSSKLGFLHTKTAWSWSWTFNNEKTTKPFHPKRYSFKLHRLQLDLVGPRCQRHRDFAPPIIMASLVYVVTFLPWDFFEPRTWRYFSPLKTSMEFWWSKTPPEGKWPDGGKTIACVTTTLIVHGGSQALQKIQSIYIYYAE